MIHYKKLVSVVILYFVLCNVVWSQSDSLQIYRERELQRAGISFFNYSKPDKFNFEIVVLGGIKQPGIYLLPEGTSLVELVALTGGTNDESNYENFKLIRAKSKNPELKADTMMVISYKDLFDKDKVGSISKQNPILKPGDIITFPIKPDKDFWDYAGRISTLFVLPLISIATLIVTVMNFNK
jgi:hypothetical protein